MILAVDYGPDFSVQFLYENESLYVYIQLLSIDINSITMVTGDVMVTKNMWLFA